MLFPDAETGFASLLEYNLFGLLSTTLRTKSKSEIYHKSSKIDYLQVEKAFSKSLGKFLWL